MHDRPGVAHQVGQRILEDDREHPRRLADRPDVAREVQAPVPQRPLGDRREHRAPLPRRAADGVHEHQRADDVGMVVGEPDRRRRRRRSGRRGRPAPRRRPPGGTPRASARSRRGGSPAAGRSAVPPKPGSAGANTWQPWAARRWITAWYVWWAERPAVERTRPACPRRPRRTAPGDPAPRSASRRPVRGRPSDRLGLGPTKGSAGSPAPAGRVPRRWPRAWPALAGAPSPSPAQGAVGSGSGCRGRVLEPGPPLELVQAAPDPVRLPDRRARSRGMARAPGSWRRSPWPALPGQPLFLALGLRGGKNTTDCGPRQAAPPATDPPPSVSTPMLHHGETPSCEGQRTSALTDRQ